MRLALSLGLLAAGCSATVEPAEIALPTTGPAEGVLLVESAAGRQLWAVAPGGPAPAPLLDWDGEPIALTYAELELAPFEIAPGPIPAPHDDDERLALGRLVGEGLVFTRELEEASLGQWTIAPEIPAAFAAIPIIDRNPPCRNARVTHWDATDRSSINDVVHVGGGRVVIAGQRFGGRRPALAGVATATSTDLRELGLERASVRVLAFDGDRTVWGVIVSVERDDQMWIAELEVDGTLRRTTIVPRAAGETPGITVAPDGTAIYFSQVKVLAFTRGSSVALDRTAAYPERMEALFEGGLDRRFAIAPKGTIYRFSAGRWVLERQPVTDVEAFSIDDHGTFAFGPRGVVKRRPDGTWQVLPDYHSSISKLGVLGLPRGRALISGNSGLLAIYDPFREAPCEIATEGVRWVQGLTRIDDTHAVAFDDYEFTVEEVTRLSWIELDRR